MNTFQKLEALKEKAKNDENLKKALLETRNSEDPMASFCRIARDNGVELYLGELFSVGLEYMDNAMKSTNGGNPTFYDDFGDMYENFLLGI